MKKIILLYALVLTTISYAQDYKEQFLGSKYLKYQGAFLKINDTLNLPISNQFFTESNQVAYQHYNFKSQTEIDSLKNKCFKVLRILTYGDKEIEDKEAAKSTTFIRFELQDTFNKSIIYFSYDKTEVSKFPFVVSLKQSELETELDSYCADYEKEFDEINNETKFNSPYTLNDYVSSPIIFYKYIKKGKARYYIALEAFGKTVSIAEQDITILFKDGSKLYKKSSIDVNVDNDSYKYSAFIPLTEKDINILSNSSIKKFRLYIYDRNIYDDEDIKIRNYAKCLLTIK